MKKTPLRPGKGLQRRTGMKPGDSRLRSKAGLAPISEKRKSQRSGPCYSTLPSVGRRGRRLKGEDRREEQLSHKLPCACGCSADPTKGEVARAHLVRRAVESVRNAEWNNVPACKPLSKWIDTHPNATRKLTGAKAELAELAQQLDRRLTQAEVEPIIRRHGYYEWRLRVDGRGAQVSEGA